MTELAGKHLGRATVSHNDILGANPEGRREQAELVPPLHELEDLVSGLTRREDNDADGPSFVPERP